MTSRIYIRGPTNETSVQNHLSFFSHHLPHRYGGAQFLNAAITTRTQEPIVLTADQFPAFAGIPVDQIFLYKYENGQWTEIPRQIDEIEIDTLQDNMAPTCQYDHDPCELSYILSGTEGNGFDSDPGIDEIVFMARDVRGSWNNTSSWMGDPNTGTYGTRYQIKVIDPKSGEGGYVYAYAWRNPQAHDPNLSDYVVAAPAGAGDNCNQTNDPACGWLRSTDEGSISGLPRFNMFFAGNWSMEALCIKPYADDSTCTVGNNSANLLDLSKWKTTHPGEREHGWDAGCRTAWPVKDGNVRLIRRIQGAQSGRYTTKVEKFYGTWFEQTVNLRVHPIGSITDWIDHRVIDTGDPGGETPSLVFTKNSWEENSSAMDPMDLVEPAPENIDTEYHDWIQVDTSRGTYLRFSEDPRPLVDSDKSFAYKDKIGASGMDNQTGVNFGQAGFSNLGTGLYGCIENTQDKVCDTNPEAEHLNFARFSKLFIPLAVDTPSGSPATYNPEDEGVLYEDYRFNNPFIVAVDPQDYQDPPPPLPGPCTPTLAGQASLDATHVNLSATGCSDYTGFMLYRGYSLGEHIFWADLKSQTSFSDMKVAHGTNVRYSVRAYDREGNFSNWSNELVIAVTDTTPPPAASGVTATPGDDIVVISWDGPGSKDVQSIEVRNSTTSSGPYILAGVPTTCNGTEAAILNLNGGSTYYFVVTTIDVAGNESVSIEVSATPY